MCELLHTSGRCPKKVVLKRAGVRAPPATTAGTDNPQLGGRHRLIFFGRDGLRRGTCSRIQPKQRSSCGGLLAVTGYSLTGPSFLDAAFQEPGSLPDCPEER
jgi:hypothetical protein